MSCSRKAAVSKNATHQAVAHQRTSPSLPLGEQLWTEKKGRSSSPVLQVSHTAQGNGTGPSAPAYLPEQHRGRARACGPGRAGSLPRSPSPANCCRHELPEQESSHNPAQHPRHKRLLAGHQRATLQAPYRRRRPAAGPQQRLGDGALWGPQPTSTLAPWPVSQMVVGEKLRDGQHIHYQVIRSKQLRYAAHRNMAILKQPKIPGATFPSIYYWKDHFRQSIPNEICSRILRKTQVNY